MKQIDYSILTRPIQKSELDSFRSHPKYKIFVGKRATGLLGAFLTFVTLVFLFSLLSTLVEVGLPVWVIVTYLWLIPVLTLAGGWGSRLEARRNEQRTYRQVMFAENNGISVIKTINTPQHQGMIFQDGHTKSSSDVYAGNDGIPFEVGNYHFTIGHGRGSSTYDWGYICIGLKKELPNMMLDGKQNNKLLGITNLPKLLKRDQVLSLEGDFDKYFTLYAPKTYEQDALYVFTPDVMALMIDNAAPYDAEIIGNRLYVYSSKQFTMTDPSTLKRIFTIIELVGNKTRSQSEKYTDAQSLNTAGRVAEHGRQLRNRFSLRKLFYVVGFVLTMLLSVVLGFIGGGSSSP